MLLIFNFSSLNVIFAPFFSLCDLIFSLALQNHIVDFCNLVFNFYLYCTDIFIVYHIILLCGISLISVSFIIHYSSRRIIDKIIKNGGNIGTGVVGLVTGLDAALNLGDRFKGEKADKGEGSSGGSGDSDSDKNKDTDKKDNDKKEDNKDSNENNTDDKKN